MDSIDSTEYGVKRKYRDHNSQEDKQSDDRRETADGIGGYGDDDYTEAQSLMSTNIDLLGNINKENLKNNKDIPDKTKDRLKKLEITFLMPIQEHCFQPIFDGHDIIGRDLTGSGKTLAFCIPLVERFRKEKLYGKSKTYLKAIILAPTRELALQVSKVLKCLRHHADEFRVITVYGGVPIDVQTRELKKGVDFFVGTTGRVLDHIRRGNMDFSQMKSVVLDEADQMLNMGFADDIESILNNVNSNTGERAQFVLFSATMPDGIKQVATKHLSEDYKMINLVENLTNKTPKNVTHIKTNVPSYDRKDMVISLLEKYGDKNSKTIIFTTTKNDARDIAAFRELKDRSEALHGDVPQRNREFVLKRFREGKKNCLVATDVASRGLDIPRVNLIIQIEPPKDPESYIHRSGRTARAGNQGVCITLYDQNSQRWIERIEDEAGVQFIELNPEELKTGGSSNDSKDGSGSGSLINGKSNYTTFEVKGRFSNKKEAYNALCDVLGKTVVNSMKCVNMMKSGKGLCFDMPNDLISELNSKYKKASRDEIDFTLKPAISLPELA